MTATKAGADACQRYHEIRERLLVKPVKATGLPEPDAVGARRRCCARCPGTTTRPRARRRRYDAIEREPVETDQRAADDRRSGSLRR